MRRIGVMMDVRGTLWSIGRARQRGAGDRSRDRQGRAASTSAAPRIGSRSAMRPAKCSSRSRPGCGRGGRRRARDASSAASRSRMCVEGHRGLARRRDALRLRADGRRVLRDRRAHATRCAGPCRSKAPTRRSQADAPRARVAGRPLRRGVVEARINHAAIYEADRLKQIASFPTPKAPMGFGFAADGKHAYLCCHDDADGVRVRAGERPHHAAVPDRGRLRVHRRLSER